MRTAGARWSMGIVGVGLLFYTVWHYIHGAFGYKGYGDFFLLLEWVRTWAREGTFDAAEWVFMYPPFFYVLNAPFVWMSNDTAIRVMLILNQLLLGISLVLLATAMTPRPSKGLWAWLLLPLALNFRPLLTLLSMAKIELLQLTLLLASLVAFQRHRPWITGGLVALAGMIKPLPLLLVLYFAWKRQWSVVKAWFVMVLVVLALCSSIIGVHPVWTYMVNLVGVGVGVSDAVPWYEDQSLRGVASRLFEPIRPSQAIYAPVPNPLSTTLEWVLRLSVLGWLGFLTRPQPGVSSGRLAGEWSAVMAGMLLLSPFSRDYYAVFLFPAYLFLAHHLWTEGARLRSPALWLGVISYLLVGQGLPLGVIELLPKPIQGVDNLRIYLHYGFPTVGYCLLVAAFACARKQTLCGSHLSTATNTQEV